MDKINKIRPFRFWCQKILPLTYDNSLSYYELLCKVVHYLNDVINEVNTIGNNYNEVVEMIVELKNYVDDYFDNLDIEKEIDDRLDELAENGTLSALLISSIHSKPVQINKKGRILYDGLKNENLYPLGGQSVFYDDMKYYDCGNISDGSTIGVYNSTGIMLNQSIIASIPHMNDMCCDSDNIYVTTGNSAVVYIVDKTNLVANGTIDFSDYFSSCTGCSYDGETLWIYGISTDQSFIRICSYIDNEISVFANLPLLNVGVYQAFLSYQDYFYIMTNESNAIYRISKITKMYDMVYTLPKGDGLYPAGEYESMFIQNGVFMVQGCVYYPTLYSEESSNQDVDTIFETDILGCISSYNPYNYMEPFTPLDVTLNPNSTYTFNPQLTVTTSLEACSIINYRKCGAIECSNVPEGSIFQLIDTKALIQNPTLDSYIDYLECVNSNVITKGFIIKNIYAIGSQVSIQPKNTNALDTIKIYQTEFKANYLNLTGITYFRAEYSFIKIKGCLGVNNDTVISKGAGTNELEFIGRYQYGIFRLLELCHRADAIITGAEGNAFILHFNSTGDMNQDFTYDLTDQSNAYKLLSYDASEGGIITLTKSNDTTTGLTTIGFPYITFNGFSE